MAPNNSIAFCSAATRIKKHFPLINTENAPLQHRTAERVTKLFAGGYLSNTDQIKISSIFI